MSTIHVPQQEPSKRERVTNWLVRLGYALVPAALVNYLGRLILSQENSSKWLDLLDVLAFLITLLVLVRLPWKILPQVLYLVITLSLLWLFLRNINWYKASPTVEWSRRLEGSLSSKCPASVSSPGNSCIVQQLGTFDRQSPAKLVDDLRVGETLMQNQRIRDVLDRCYGIKDEFLGTGLSLPDSADGNYGLARIPEYWIKNLSDKDPRVWTWKAKLDSRDMSQSLTAFLEHHSPLVPHERSFKTEMEANAGHLSPTDMAPVLVRFAQFPTNHYQNYIGRVGTDLVFANHFGELAKLELSVADSASYSGRSIQRSGDASDLFVWVVFVQNNRQAIPATWHNLLAYISDETVHNRLSSACQE